MLLDIFFWGGLGSSRLGGGPDFMERVALMHPVGSDPIEIPRVPFWKHFGFYQDIGSFDFIEYLVLLSTPDFIENGNAYGQNHLTIVSACLKKGFQSLKKT